MVRVAQEGDTAIGIRKFNLLRDTKGGIELNPDRVKAITIEEPDEVVVLTTCD